MPVTPHHEKHFTGSETIRDIVIGMSDGLTVPFALTAGLSSAVDASTIVITAGLAEIAAGSIAMGPGGYLAGKSDADHYASELAREQSEVKTMPEAETAEITQILQKYGLSNEESLGTLDGFHKHPAWWIEFMMRIELGLEKPDANRALTSGLTIGLAYIAGGLIPLSPYFFCSHYTDRAVVFGGSHAYRPVGLWHVPGNLYGRGTHSQRDSDSDYWGPGRRSHFLDREGDFIN